MSFPYATSLLQKALLLFVFLSLVHVSFSQKADSAKVVQHIAGAISVTNNGFSFIPTFSLGKPAAIFSLYMGGRGKRFSFEPEFRFALEGKPWSFIFVWRYKLVRTNKFQFTVGTHLPALNFRTVSVVKNGTTLDVIQTTRFFPVVEASPNYLIAKNVSVGSFYLYGHGVEPDVVQNTHFLSLRAGFSYIPLFKKLYLRFFPQAYYLKSDQKDGFYWASNIVLGLQKFPLSVSSMMNKVIETDVPGEDFQWNLGLIYSFGKDFVEL